MQRPSLQRLAFQWQSSSSQTRFQMPNGMISQARQCVARTSRASCWLFCVTAKLLGGESLPRPLAPGKSVGSSCSSRSRETRHGCRGMNTRRHGMNTRRHGMNTFRLLSFRWTATRQTPQVFWHARVVGIGLRSSRSASPARAFALLPFQEDGLCAGGARAGIPTTVPAQAEMPCLVNPSNACMHRHPGVHKQAEAHRGMQGHRQAHSQS